MNSNLGNFKLYNALQSTCSQRVRYTLHYKNLSFSMEILDLFSGDQLKPEYLKINPNGVVPAIDHDGKIIIDSSVIIEYLEDIDPDLNSLRPKSWHWIKSNINIELLKKRFNELDYSISKDTVRQDSLGQQELIYLYKTKYS